MLFIYSKKLLDQELLGLDKTTITSDPLQGIIGRAAAPRGGRSLLPPMDHLLTGEKYHEITDDSELKDLVSMGLSGVFTYPGEELSNVIHDEIVMSDGSDPGGLTPCFTDGLCQATIRGRDAGRTNDQQILYHPFVVGSTVQTITSGTTRLGKNDGTYLNAGLFRQHHSITREYQGMDEEGYHIFETRIRSSFRMEGIHQVLAGANRMDEPVPTFEVTGAKEDFDTPFTDAIRIVRQRYFLIGWMLGESEHFLYSVRAFNHGYDVMGQHSYRAPPDTISSRSCEILMGTHLRPFNTEGYLDLHFDAWKDRIDSGPLPSAVWSIKSHDERRRRALDAVGDLPEFIGKTHIFAPRPAANRDWGSCAHAFGYFYGNGTQTFSISSVDASDVLGEATPHVAICGSFNSPDPNLNGMGSNITTSVVVNVGPYGTVTTVLARGNSHVCPAIGIHPNREELTNAGITLPYADIGVTDSPLPPRTYGLDVEHTILDDGVEWTETPAWKFHGAPADVGELILPDPDADGSTNEADIARRRVIQQLEDDITTWKNRIEDSPVSIHRARELARYHYAFPLLG